MGDRQRIELFGALQSLYQGREYSDLTICTSDGIRHPVHKAIVCPRSSRLTKLVKEGNWRDGVVGDLLLQNEDPEVIRHLIEFMYLLDYEPLPRTSGSTSPRTDSNSDTMSVRTEAVHFGHVYGTSAVSAFGGPRDLQSPFSTGFGHSRERSGSSLTIHALPDGDFGDFSSSAIDRRHRPSARSRAPSSAPESSPLATQEPHLILHAKMYAVADIYEIAGLKALALEKFKIQLTRHWDSLEFPEAIHIVFETTPASDKHMRGAVADTLGWHSRLLDKPEIEVTIMEINGLAYELLRRSRRTEHDYD